MSMRIKPARRPLVWLFRLLALAALLLVFLAYAQPSLMQSLGDQLWACF